MRNKEKAITDKAALVDIMAKSQVVYLGLTDEDGSPFVVPVSFGFDGEDCLYFHSSYKGRKIRCIRANALVGFCMAVDMEPVVPEDPAKACKWSMAYRSIIGSGTAEIVENAEEKQHGLEVLMRHFTDTVPLFKDAVLPKTALVRIRIKEMMGKQDHQDQA